MAIRDCRPLAWNSLMCAFEEASSGAELKGVLTSEASALVRKTVSAAKKPPGVRVMPLNWMEVGGPGLSSPEPPPRAALEAMDELDAPEMDSALDEESAGASPRAAEAAFSCSS